MFVCSHVSKNMCQKMAAQPEGCGWPKPAMLRNCLNDCQFLSHGCCTVTSFLSSLIDWTFKSNACYGHFGIYGTLIRGERVGRGEWHLWCHGEWHLWCHGEWHLWCHGEWHLWCHGEWHLWRGSRTCVVCIGAVCAHQLTDVSSLLSLWIFKT